MRLFSSASASRSLSTRIVATSAASRTSVSVLASATRASRTVEARLKLLDEVVFERQRLALVIDQDRGHVGRLAHQRVGFGLGNTRFQEIRAHAAPQRLGLADVDHLSGGVLELVDAGLGGEVGEFFRGDHYQY